MAERIPIEALQQAIYTRLSTDLGALSPAIPVYSFMAPQDASYPYAVLSQFSFTPDNTKGSAVQDSVVTVEIYSDSKSATQLNAAINATIASFTSAALSLADNFADIFGVGDQEQVDAFATFDGIRTVLQGIVKYRWSVEDRS